MSHNTSGSFPIPNEAEFRRIREGLRLSPTEGQVVALIVQDLGVKQVARALGRKESTVRTHVRLIHAKLGVTSNVGVAVLAMRALMFGRKAQDIGRRPRQS